MERSLNHLNNWSGDRIVIFGDYTRFDDLPDGIFTDDEKKFIDDYIALVHRAEGQEDGGGEEDIDEEGRDEKDRDKEDSDGDDSDEDDVDGDDSSEENRNDRPSMMDFDTRFVEKRCYSVGASREYCELEDLLSKDMLRRGRDRTVLTWAIMPLFNDERVEDLILRNITTQAYVCGSALKDIDDDYPEFSRFWGLGDLLLLRICWSSDPDACIAYDRNITRGPWAGHRFDIIDRSKLTKDDSGRILPGWTDVTEEVIDEAVRLYELQKGFR